GVGAGIAPGVGVDIAPGVAGRMGVPKGGGGGGAAPGPVACPLPEAIKSPVEIFRGGGGAFSPAGGDRSSPVFRGRMSKPAPAGLKAGALCPESSLSKAWRALGFFG